MNVDDVVAARIAAARMRIESQKKARAAQRAARDKGLAQRHAAKLRAQAARRPQPPVATPEPTNTEENPMQYTAGSVLNLTPSAIEYAVTFGLSDGKEKVTCPVIAWATVVQAHLNDGAVHTAVQPVFVWGDLVWNETELREHTPTLEGFEIRPVQVLGFQLQDGAIAA